MRSVLFAVAAATVLSMPVSASAVTFAGAGFSIPDANPTGASSTLTVNRSGIVQGLDLSLFGFNHTWVGDLSGRLTHAGVTVDWMQQSNVSNSRNLNGDYVIRDGAALALNDATSSPITPGVYASENPFAAFDGTSWEGDWTLTLADNALADLGALGSWGLNLAIAGVGGAIPDATPTGFSSTITLSDTGRVDDLAFSVFNLGHTWMGDLRGTLSHGGVTVDWFRPSLSNSQNLGGDYVFSDSGLVTLDAATGQPRPSGLYSPASPLAAFHGVDAAGDWVLTIADNTLADLGGFDGWNIHVNTYVPEPGTWALMILGFGAVGAAMRRRSLATA